ncbi:MAG: 23S rRNA (adenine(2503)-C(2))-methyltransferase RlmN [Nitrospirota bacterium]|nr:23S rRNA (adenine(2503)-C(2))-methyltransferase RlmN [Nitrospirota bacterium]
MHDLKELDAQGLTDFVQGLGLEAYRSRQLRDWIYRKRASTFDEMTNISREVREKLKGEAFIGEPTLLEARRSSDGTTKLLLEMRDGHHVESVIIPEEDRLTLCVSSQVGCALGCRFCLTGKGGLARNLTAGEIVSQVMAAEKLIATDSSRERRLTNLVFMGMGEPLANFDEVAEALRRLTDPEWMAFSGRRITVSTAGLVPGIRKLAASGLKVRLAVSLNATTDEVRDDIMPVNRRYPIATLLEACREYPLTPRDRITFEYVMLKDINDSLDDAKRLVKMLKGIPCKVNLIPFNEFPGSEFRRPAGQRVNAFQEILMSRNFTAFVRQSKGADISAACGQLRADRQKGNAS